MHEQQESDRHSLIADNIDLPRAVAARMFALPSRGDCGAPTSYGGYSDAVADGYVGLVEAADSFDPSKGASFRTFARWRVHGEMLDAARRMAPYSKHHWTRLRESQGADEAAVVHVSLDETQLDDAAIDSEMPDVEVAIDRRRTLGRVLDAVAKLPERQRAIIESHYFQKRSILDTAKLVGYSEFTTSRIHAQLIRSLREVLTAEDAAEDQS